MLALEGSSAIDGDPTDPMTSKRASDLILALAASPFVALAVLTCAVAVRLSSPGPAIFRQTRVGRNEQPFTCLKLRTMHQGTPNAPSHETGVAAVTPVGQVLRRFKFDELPQLWNILRGDMSLVGPRPCLPSQTALIDARRARGLAALRPGITGVSQIAGVDMSDPEGLAALDATYLADMSLRRDLAIILATATGAGRGDRTAHGR